MMRRPVFIRRFSLAAAVSFVLAAAGGTAAEGPVFGIERASDQAAAPAPQKPAKKGPMEKLNEPWPDAAKLEERRAESERLALFASAEPLVMTISADFDAINKIREPDSPTRLPGVLELAGEGGEKVSFQVQLGTRGHLRLNPRTCSMVPLRVEFTKKDVKGSVFDSQGALKLVTHCRNDNGVRAERAGRAPGVPNRQPPHAALLPDATREGDLRRFGEAQVDRHSLRDVPRRRRRRGPAERRTDHPAAQPGVQAARPGFAHGDVAPAVHDRQHRLLDHLAAQRQADAASRRSASHVRVRLRPGRPRQRRLRDPAQGARDCHGA